MEGARVNTSQNVIINYNLADISKRILARLLDWVFIFVYIMIFYMIFTGIVANESSALEFLDANDGTWAIILLILISFPIVFYSLWTSYFMQGQTFGKKILKIKIVKVDGAEASFGTYFVRWLLNFVDSFFYNIVGLAVMGSTQKRQRVADLVAGTVVISIEKTVRIDQTIFSQIEENYYPKFSQILQLSDKDMQIIKSSLERAKMRMDHNLVKKLREKTESVIHEYKPEMTDVEYVETVIKDYQYYSQQ